MLVEGTRVGEDIERGATRGALQQLLPPGGARNALDCAFWDLEAKQAGQPVWALAGLQQPRALRSTLTLGADSAENMAKAALAIDPQAPIKVKLTGDLADDSARIEAIRAERPDAWRSEERRVGKERVSTCRYRWSPDN